MKPGKFDENTDHLMTSVIEEIAVGPYVLCGRNEDDDPALIYSGESKEIYMMLSTYFPGILEPEFTTHNVKDSWVPYLQIFMERMECPHMFFAMRDGEGNAYHAVHGNGNVIGHTIVDVLDYLIEN